MPQMISWFRGCCLCDILVCGLVFETAFLSPYASRLHENYIIGKAAEGVIIFAIKYGLSEKTTKYRTLFCSLLVSYKTENNSRYPPACMVNESWSMEKIYPVEFLPKPTKETFLTVHDNYLLIVLHLAAFSPQVLIFIA